MITIISTRKIRLILSNPTKLLLTEATWDYDDDNDCKENNNNDNKNVNDSSNIDNGNNHHDDNNDIDEEDKDEDPIDPLQFHKAFHVNQEIWLKGQKNQTWHLRVIS